MLPKCFELLRLALLLIATYCFGLIDLWRARAKLSIMLRLFAGNSLAFLRLLISDSATVSIMR